MEYCDKHPIALVDGKCPICEGGDAKCQQLKLQLERNYRSAKNAGKSKRVQSGGKKKSCRG